MQKPILEIKDLTKYYGNIKGVENLSLTLNKGEVFGFIGPNGAGKSTTIRSIMNLINKTRGQVYIYGQEFTKDCIDIKEKIGYLPGEIHLYDDLTVKATLDYHASFYAKDTHKRRQELVKKLNIDEKKTIEDLSLGNLKKVAIVLALMHEPEILILDEPTSGLDPIMQNVFYDILKEEKEKKTTILYSTHILSELSKICDRVGIIKEGRLITIENMDELNKKNLSYVTVISKDISKIIEDLKLTNYTKNDLTIKFPNTISSNKLIKSLSKYSIDKILIEEASLEEIFMHYYE